MCVCVCVCAFVHVFAYVDAEESWMPGIHLKNDLHVHNEAHTHVACDILPLTEMQMAKTGVTCLCM